MNSNIQIISIEGNIGSGKSTLLENLRVHFENCKNIIFLKEPVDDWSNIKDENNVTMLEKFYKDQKKYSFAFQMMAYISRLSLLKQTIEKKEFNKNSVPLIIITERSLYTDKFVFAQMLFDTGNLEYIQFQIYLKWFDEFIKEYPINKMIYVKTTPEICHSRILKRSRTGEDVISIDYLKHCDKYHNDMLNTSSKKCVCNQQLILNGNNNIFEDSKELEKWIQQINDFIYTLEHKIT